MLSKYWVCVEYSGMHNMARTFFRDELRDSSSEDTKWTPGMTVICATVGSKYDCIGIVWVLLENNVDVNGAAKQYFKGFQATLLYSRIRKLNQGAAQ